MASQFNQNKYIQEYNKQNYDRVNLILPKGEKEKIKALAKKNGESINKYIITAIEQRILDEKDD